MPQTKTGLRIFVASSSDVKQERSSLKKVVAKLDNRYDRQGLDLQVIAWEDSVRPDFGFDPQDVINRQINFDLIDIFIGIVWSRIGTSTPRALSGTVEEVNRALDARRRTGRPWSILFYLCDRPYSPSTPDEARQWGEVQKFKNWINSNSLNRHYQESDEFEDLLENDLSMAVDDFIQNQRATLAPPPQPMPLIVNQIDPFNLQIWCPWCRNLGPLTIMPIQAYQMHRGQVWPCPRCGGPQFFA
jgi:hypothetical protein